MLRSEENKNDDQNLEEEISMDEVKQDFIDAFKIIGETINKNLFSREKMTWQSFIQKLSDEIDKDILSYQKESGKTFLGGKCIMKKKANKKGILISAEQYFHDAETQKTVKHITTRDIDFSRLDLNDAETKQKVTLI